jgi:hypothetical protein
MMVAVRTIGFNLIRIPFEEFFRVYQGVGGDGFQSPIGGSLRPPKIAASVKAAKAEKVIWLTR